MAPPPTSSSSGIATGPDELQTPCSYYQMTWGGDAAAAPSAKKKEEVDEDFDLFGEPSEADKAKAKELAAAKKADGAKKKKVVVEKSSLVIDIKPGSADTDLDRVLKMVWAIEMDGMTWNQASKKVPIAFGLYKLQVACSIEDAKVNTNELIEKIEALGLTEEQAAKRLAEEDDDDDEEEEEEYLVQSAEIISFSKLT